jgi:hypothetical protein
MAVCRSGPRSARRHEEQPAAQDLIGVWALAIAGAIQQGADYLIGEIHPTGAR